MGIGHHLPDRTMFEVRSHCFVRPLRSFTVVPRSAAAAKSTNSKPKRKNNPAGFSRPQSPRRRLACHHLWVTKSRLAPQDQLALQLGHICWANPGQTLFSTVLARFCPLEYRGWSIRVHGEAAPHARLWSEKHQLED